LNVPSRKSLSSLKFSNANQDRIRDSSQDLPSKEYQQSNGYYSGFGAYPMVLGITPRMIVVYFGPLVHTSKNLAAGVRTIKDVGNELSVPELQPGAL
jgi:hypothetical protein